MVDGGRGGELRMMVLGYWIGERRRMRLMRIWWEVK